MLLFYMLQKYLMKVEYFLKIYYHTTHQYSKLHGTSFNYTSNVCVHVYVPTDHRKKNYAFISMT